MAVMYYPHHPVSKSRDSISGPIYGGLNGASDNSCGMGLNSVAEVISWRSKTGSGNGVSGASKVYSGGGTTSRGGNSTGVSSFRPNLNGRNGGGATTASGSELSSHQSGSVGTGQLHLESINRLRSLCNQRMYDKAAEVVPDVSLDDLVTFLRDHPMDFLGNSIPASFSLIHALYARIVSCHMDQELKQQCLKADLIMMKLVNYTVKVNPTSHEYKQSESHMEAISHYSAQLDPRIRTRLAKYRAQIDADLEGLGLHGLINSSRDDRLVDVEDAALAELIENRKRIKLVNLKFIQLIHESRLSNRTVKLSTSKDYSLKHHSGPVPTSSSHQRLMRLRVSDVKERMRRNANALELLQSVLTNEAIESLIKVLHRRVALDQEVVQQHKLLSNSTKAKRRGISPGNDDPVLFDFLLCYSKAFSAVLAMMPEGCPLEDSRIGEERRDPMGSDMSLHCADEKKSLRRSRASLASSPDRGAHRYPSTGTTSGRGNYLHPSGTVKYPYHHASHDNLTEESSYEVPISRRQQGRRSFGFRSGNRNLSHPELTSLAAAESTDLLNSAGLNSANFTMSYSRLKHSRDGDVKGLKLNAAYDIQYFYPPPVAPVSSYHPSTTDHQYQNVEIARLQDNLRKVTVELEKARRKVLELSSIGSVPSGNDNDSSLPATTAPGLPSSPVPSAVANPSGVKSPRGSSLTRSSCYGSLSPNGSNCSTASRHSASTDSGGGSGLDSFGDHHGSSVSRGCRLSSSAVTKAAPVTESSRLVETFGNLYTQNHAGAIQMLGALPDFDGSEELQQKILISVIILSYRSVEQTLEKAKSAMWQTIESALTSEGDSHSADESSSSESSGSTSSGEASTPGVPEGGRKEDAVTQTMDWHLLAYLRRKAEKTNYYENTKVVTSQLWATLYDFPSIKSCQTFNAFLQDCIRISWDLQTTTPGYLLDYDSKLFSPDKHVRFYTSKVTSNVIKKYIWPGLTESCTGKCVYRGVVVT